MVTNLDDLDAACERVGLTLVRNRKEYRWYGEAIDDQTAPEGFTLADLGKCEHSIRLADYEDGERYEIGVVRRRDGKPGYALLWDDFDQLLRRKVGAGAGLLKQAYALSAARRTAMAQGFRVMEKKLANGKVQLVCAK